MFKDVRAAIIGRDHEQRFDTAPLQLRHAAPGPFGGYPQYPFGQPLAAVTHQQKSPSYLRARDAGQIELTLNEGQPDFLLPQHGQVTVWSGGEPLDEFNRVTLLPFKGREIEQQKRLDALIA